MILRLAARRLTMSSAGSRSASAFASRSFPSLASFRRDGDDDSPRRISRTTTATTTATATPTIIPRTYFSSVSAPPAQQVDVFPSIVIHSTLNAQINDNNGLQPQGSFAEAQAAFLNPPKETIRSLLGQLLKHNIGIVAHYYMDVELQGILHGVKRLQMDLLNRQQQHQQQQQQQQQIPLDEELLEIYRQMDLPPTHAIPAHPLVAIADSLAMGDHAVRMCSPVLSGGAAASSIICLGVDFMSESVAAIMARNGCGHVPVYRAATRHIGCSLAESAEGRGYEAWLRKFGDASSSPSSSDKKALHVVYINTSLETKATSASILPTITCTSSNVLQTILQASAQMGPDRLQICYGPDTYMGENLKSLLDAVLSHDESWTDSRIRDELHPLHTRESLRHLRDNLHVYPHGNCIVHHMFGNSVVETVSDKYADAYVTAHLEVPGEMFQIALEKSMNDEGVVGSTSNILQFIERKVEEAAKDMPSSRQHPHNGSQPHNGSTPQSQQSSSPKRRLKFILGTEAGMVTSIVRSVQDILDAHRCHDVEAEIIFPVSSEAVMGVEDDAEGTNDSSLGVVPGVAGGEGCSTAGGCATCPFMKMNDLDAVHDLVDMIQSMRGADDGNDGNDGDTNNYRNKVELQLRKHLPPNRLKGKSINGRDAIELGSEPIVFMRHFMKNKVMSDDLVQRIERMGQL